MRIIGGIMGESEVQLFRCLYEQSLKNADRWIKDAKLLIQNSSYGHASALLRFATEEAAKAIVCWYVSEGIWPAESRPVKDVFRHHVAKNQVVLAVFSGIQWRELKEKGLTKTPEITDQEIARDWKIFEQMTFGMEKKRQSAIYVDLKPKGKAIESPESIREEQVKVILKGTEFIFAYASNMAEAFPEPVREKFREYFKSLPKEVWKTGYIRID
jgi:AbiV family abortive infection protein